MRFLQFVCLFASLASTLTQAQSNPVPLINQPLVPMTAAPGGSGFTLTVNGTGFVSGSVVNWNGSALTTTFVTSSQLSATVPASKIATANTASVTVTSPAGGTSNVEFFDVSPSTSTLTFAQLLPNPGFNASVTPKATGDFNGDGKLDVTYLVGGPFNSVVIQLGNGDGTFSAPVDYAVGDTPQALVVGDFNGDGKLDLAVGNYFGQTVSVLLGNGDGTFQAQTTYPLPGGAESLVTGDFNGDGKLDLAVGQDNVTIPGGATVSQFYWAMAMGLFKATSITTHHHASRQ